MNDEALWQKSRQVLSSEIITLVLIGINCHLMLGIRAN